MLSPNAILHWESVNNPNITLDGYTLQPRSIDGNPIGILDLTDYSLAISGDVFRWVVDYAPVEILHKVYFPN